MADRYSTYRVTWDNTSTVVEATSRGNAKYQIALKVARNYYQDQKMVGHVLKRLGCQRIGDSTLNEVAR